MDLLLTRPLALAALALPLVVLVAARARSAPRVERIGTFSWWRDRARAVPAADRERSRWPLELVLCVCALVAGALALAEPQWGRARALPWTFVVDRSRSMWLPVEPGRNEPTRYAAAALDARAWLETELGGGDARWVALVDGAWREHVGPAPPAAWATAEPSGPVPFDSFDRPGVVWVTDRPRAAAAAGLVASGGAAVPGPIGQVRAARGARTLVWDGERVSARPDASAGGGVFVDPDLPAAVVEVVALWTELRLLRTVASAAEATVLRVAGPPPEASTDVAVTYRASGDGWALVGPARPLVPSAEELAHVVATGAGGALTGLVLEPGRLRVAFGSSARVEGDRRRFATDLAAACDRAARPGRDVVALADRRAAGSPTRRRPRAARPDESGGGESAAGAHVQRLAAPGLALAGALALAALVTDALRRRRRRSRARSAVRSAS